MLKENKLRRLLKEGKPTLGTRIWSSWPTITEAAGFTGLFDYIEFQVEYAPFNQYDLENIVRAAELHNMSTMIKVDFQNRGYVGQKALASGFQSIMFTDHHSAKEVKETIQLMRPEHPRYGGALGNMNRRWIGFRDELSTQDQYAQMVADSVMSFMIEKEQAVEEIDEICSVPGVDMIQFGPSDYSMSNGFNRTENPDRVKAAEIKVIESALKHGVRPRIELNSAKDADYYIKMGVRDFNIGSEIRVMTNFWNEHGKALRDTVK